MRGWAIGVGALWLATACGTASPPTLPTPASTVAAPRPPVATATTAPPATATRSAEGTPVIRIVSTSTDASGVPPSWPGASLRSGLLRDSKQSSNCPGRSAEPPPIHHHDTSALSAWGITVRSAI